MLITRKSLVLGAALVLGSALSASAADLGGSLKDAPTIVAPAPTGWYLRVDGGYNFMHDPTVDLPGFTTDATMDNTWSVGGGIGRYFGYGFRGDLTVDHLFNAEMDTTVVGPVSGTSKLDFNSTVLLANLYYDFNRGGRFIPYIGGGVGFAHNEFDTGSFSSLCGCVSTVNHGSDNHFAAAAMAGVSWRIRGGEPVYDTGLKDDHPVMVSGGNALYLDLGYRFLWLGDVKTGDIDTVPTPTKGPDVKDLYAHELRVGLRYDLN